MTAIAIAQCGSCSYSSTEVVLGRPRFRSGHAAPPTVVQYYGVEGTRLLSAGDARFPAFVNFQGSLNCSPASVCYNKSWQFASLCRDISCSTWSTHS